MTEGQVHVCGICRKDVGVGTPVVVTERFTRYRAVNDTVQQRRVGGGLFHAACWRWHDDKVHQIGDEYHRENERGPFEE